MKIFVCGQKSFGRSVLKALYEDGHYIVGIAPPPQKKYKDKMVGYALLKEIPIVTDCEKLTSDFIPDGTDLIVSAHSHWVISDQCLEKCKHGGIGFHPSLLPRHRGKDAVRWTIHMKDYLSGGTVYKLDGKVDGGDILAQALVWVKPEWNHHDLWNAIFPVGVRLIVETVQGIEHGTLCPNEQDEECATWEPSWDRPRLMRNELLQIGNGAETVDSGGPEECDGCERECKWCTYNIADPSVYYKRDET